MSLAEVLATAPAEDFFWWSLISTVAAVAGFLGWYTFVRRTRVIEDTPTSRIRSAAQGYVELEGRARLMEGPPIRSPLSATTCAWWRYQIEKKRRDHKGRTHWDTVEKKTSDECFLLVDATGECVVDPVGATVIPAVKFRWYGTTPFPRTGPINALGTSALRSMLSLGGGDYRYTEELILPATEVYALGSFRTQSGAPDTFDEKADLTTLLQKWKHDKQMMALLDRNKDGQVDAKEWEAARRMAQDKVRQEHVRRSLETPDLDILHKPKDARPYILSGVPQAQLVRRFRYYAAGCIAVFCGAGSFTIFALIARGLL